MRKETRPTRPEAALLTGGGDRPYALGLASSLIAEGVPFDFIGSDALDSPELRQSPFVRFLNLRGEMEPDAPLARKVKRLGAYYARLIHYATTAEAPIFHILWNNKVEIFDRTLLSYFYRFLGKRLILTVHNVNAAKRDGKDSAINRYTLRKQYHLMDHLFVHTEKMKRELCTEFGVAEAKITVIPFGLNSSVPNTALTREEARQRLGFDGVHKLILFFGNIAPYKGLEYLVEAMTTIRRTLPESRLLIVGRPKGATTYWQGIERQIAAASLDDAVYKRIEYVSDDDIEVFFKAADVLVLPYISICQSGVLFLGYNFGLPVVATDVGDLEQHVLQGSTGMMCPARNSHELARTILDYFASEMYRRLPSTRQAIQGYGNQTYAWADVAARTAQIYRSVVGRQSGASDGSGRREIGAGADNKAAG